MDIEVEHDMLYVRRSLRAIQSRLQQTIEAYVSRVVSRNVVAMATATKFPVL